MTTARDIDFFDILPDELLLQNFSRLPIETFAKFSSTNHRLNRVLKDNLLWRQKFARHFPHIFVTLESEPINWFQEFGKCYWQEYKNLQYARSRKLFYWVKEGNLSRLRDCGLSHSDLDIEDINGKNLLQWAHEHNHQELLDYFYQLAIKAYSKFGKSRLLRTVHFRTILNWAVLCRQSKTIITDLISEGAKDILSGENSILLAVLQGRTDIVELLIESKINEIDSVFWGETALLAAVQKGYKSIVNLLLRYDVNINIPLPFNHPYYLKFNVIAGDTPIEAAIKHGFKDIVEALLPKVQNIDKIFNRYHTLLRLAAEQGQDEIAKLLIERGADINARGRDFETALLIAIEHGHKNVVDVLLANNANVNLALRPARESKYHLKFKSETNDTPLHVAIRQGQKEIVEMLIEKGASIEARNISTFNAFLLAAQQGQMEILKLLLDRDGVDINQRSIMGATALLLAIEEGHEDVVDVLLEYKADVNLALLRDGQAYHRDKYNVVPGDTPLHIAARRGDAGIVQKLIRSGANFEVLNSEKKTALMVAKGKECVSELKLLNFYKKIYSTEEKKSFFTLFSAKKASIEEQREASNALVRVVFSNADKSSLDEHQNAFNNSDLAPIYRGLGFKLMWHTRAKVSEPNGANLRK